METGILFRWGMPKPGRERESIDLYHHAVAYFRRLAGEGKLTLFEPFLLSTGDSEKWKVESGGFLIRGPVPEVFAMIDSSEFRDVMSRVGLLTEYVRMDTLTVGEAIDRSFADAEKLLTAMNQVDEAQWGR